MFLVIEDGNFAAWLQTEPRQDKEGKGRNRVFAGSPPANFGQNGDGLQLLPRIF